MFGVIGMIRFFFLIYIHADITMASDTLLGTHFALVFPPLGTNVDDHKSFLIISNDNSQMAEVFCTTPELNYNEAVTVNGNSFKKVYIPKGVFSSSTDIIQENGVEIIETAGVKITVTVVIETLYSIESFVVFPTQALGLKYNIISPHLSTYCASFVSIVSMTANTNLELAFPTGVNIKDLQSYQVVGGKIQIEIGSAYEVITIRYYGDLTGLQIFSDELIAVFTGCDYPEALSTTDSLTDKYFMIDQVPPVNHVGQEYILTTIGPYNQSSFFVVMATSDNSTIMIHDGNKCNYYSKDNSDVLQQKMTSEALYIKSNYPVVVSQIMWSSAGDPAMVYLTPLDGYAYDKQHIYVKDAGIDDVFGVVLVSCFTNIHLKINAVNPAVKAYEWVAIDTGVGVCNISGYPLNDGSINSISDTMEAFGGYVVHSDQSGLLLHVVGGTYFTRSTACKAGDCLAIDMLCPVQGQQTTQDKEGEQTTDVQIGTMTSDAATQQLTGSSNVNNNATTPNPPGSSNVTNNATSPNPIGSSNVTNNASSPNPTGSSNVTNNATTPNPTVSPDFTNNATSPNSTGSSNLTNNATTPNPPGSSNVTSNATTPNPPGSSNVTNNASSPNPTGSSNVTNNATTPNPTVSPNVTNNASSPNPTGSSNVTNNATTPNPTVSPNVTNNATSPNSTGSSNLTNNATTPNPTSSPNVTNNSTTPNPTASHSNAVFPNINGVPIVSVPNVPNPIRVFSQDRVELQCIVSGYSITHVYWQKYQDQMVSTLDIDLNRNKLQGSEVFSPSLTIANVSLYDKGSYKCFAMNGYGTGSSGYIELDINDQALATFVYVPPETKDQYLKDRTAELKQELKVDKKTLSRAYRRQTCAADTRPSAAVSGYVGVVLLVITFGTIFMLDITTLWDEIRNRCLLIDVLVNICRR